MHRIDVQKFHPLGLQRGLRYVACNGTELSFSTTCKELSPYNYSKFEIALGDIGRHALS